jgi:4-hydroxythreonine-4-phosphate dehydrogenase
MLPLALSLGCPSGIGPEVTLAALAARPDVNALVFGSFDVLAERAPLVGFDRARLVRWQAIPRAIDPSLVHVIDSVPLLSVDARPGRSTTEGGLAQLRWIDEACDAVAAGVASALVTGPVSKEAIARSGGCDHFLGHTEYLAERLHSPKRPIMAFVADRLIVSLVTTHLPLAKVPENITEQAVFEAIVETARLVAAIGRHVDRPIAVCALNPHAGEGGLLGDEERLVIAPAIARAQATDLHGCSVVGPVPAEAAFRKAAADPPAYAACLAMYHDQATIPAKLVAFGDAVNVTLGLPIVRTSVDHGTGYDIAGKGMADARGMISAIDLAQKLVTSKP